jgi:hypothetical protein
VDIPETPYARTDDGVHIAYKSSVTAQPTSSTSQGSSRTWSISGRLAAVSSRGPEAGFLLPVRRRADQGRLAPTSES